MHRLLERLDASASTLVPLLYLTGLMLGAIAYFAGITLNLELGVGIALASAAELHSFLQQRRARATYARFSRLTEADAEYEVARRQYLINVWILIGLLSFSAFNATAFIAETWTPAPGPLWLRWIQIGVRGLVVPALFFAAGFLVPLHLDASDQLRSTSAEMLRRTLKAIDRQWRARLKRAEKRSADLAPVAIALLQEAGDFAAAKRIELIAGGLFAAEHGAATTTTVSASASTQKGGALDTPTSPALPAVNVESQRLSRHDARRAALAADMYGQRGHPTSPRGAAVSTSTSEDYDANASESSGDEWSLGDLLASADDYGAFDDDGPEAFTSSNASNGHRRPASKRGSAARVASRGAELVVREFVMPDLPPSKYERDEDSDQRRAVFRVLDQDASISREELMRRAGVSDGTARLARSLWNERRSKRGQKRAAPRTTEMAAITPEMLQEAQA